MISSLFNVVRIVWLAGIVGLMAVGSAGCGEAGPDRDPRMNRARTLANSGDLEGAVEWYEKALQRRPGLARAHWELAELYDRHLRNDLRAIYHYEKFLELNPGAERRDLVEQLIGNAKLSYAASLPSQPNQAVRMINQLQREKQALAELLEAEREEIRRLRAMPVARTDGPGTVGAGGAVAGTGADAAPPAAGRMDSYVVQPGDTLSRIAGKVYNDASRWNVIYEANRDVLRSPASIRVGQTLKIPRP
ncbi:MAG TPA: LysM peptidoglycan-binding domain-containing protein [Kiritimatiellia bacterium]|nr:LysM peptidoglycan-binding domain-containing protein [Kiritimatiellia bacterium]